MHNQQVVFMGTNIREHINGYFKQFHLVLVQINEHVESLNHSDLQVAKTRINYLFRTFLRQRKIPERSEKLLECGDLRIIQVLLENVN